MSMVSGIYKITHVPSGDTYVGSAVNIHRRWNQHRYRLLQGTHHNRNLQSLWSRDGEGAFQFSELERCETSDLLDREFHWFIALEPALNHIPPGGSGMTGRKHTLESRAKMGRNWSPEERARIGEHHHGKYGPGERKVVAVDPATGAARVFRSLAAAARDVHGSAGNIHGACNGRKPHAYGLSWAYLGSPVPVRDSQYLPPRRLPVERVDPVTGEVRSFESLTAAAHAVDKPAGISNIRLACLGVRSSAYGYYWRFMLD
jgi:hypothetical protein